jgi:hypothetical protein
LRLWTERRSVGFGEPGNKYYGIITGQMWLTVTLPIFEDLVLCGFVSNWHETVWHNGPADLHHLLNGKCNKENKEPLLRVIFLLCRQVWSDSGCLVF